MSCIMAIGNDLNLGTMNNLTVTGIHEKNDSFTKVIGENLKGIVTVPENPNLPKISSYEDSGEKLSGGKMKERLESKLSKDDSTKDTDSLKESCEDVKNTIKEEIKDKLDVCDEELEEKMAELGFTDANLLNPQDVLTLCLELGGAEEMDLLTNDSLYQAITEIMNDLQSLVSDIEKTYQVNPEQITEIMTGNLSEEEPVVLVKEQELTEKEDVQTVEMDTKEQMVTNESKTTQKEETKQDDEKKESSEHTNHSVVDHTDAMKNNEAVNSVTNSDPNVSYTTSSTQNIMTQMIESMKMEISPEVTELKMQLHPESLGNVSVQLTAKEGAVTATFTAQNEVVKNALETQMIQLKETLQEKGIQVEAIEVKVDAGAYNEQYQDAKGNEDAKAQFEKEMKKNTTRRINLTDYADSEEPGELDEAEELTVKMMKENGNSLDYSA